MKRAVYLLVVCLAASFGLAELSAGVNQAVAATQQKAKKPVKKKRRKPAPAKPAAAAVERAVPTAQPDVPAADSDAEIERVEGLFASNCGFCHGDGGRKPGRAPQLMGSARSDEELASRIRDGKSGVMPAYGQMFDERQVADIVRYIRALKPRS